MADRRGPPLFILVTGATGYIGGRLVPELLAAGHRARVLVRDPRKLGGVTWRDRVEIVTGDVLAGATLPAAVAGVDVAYYLVHAMGSTAGGFAQRDHDAAANFGRAAAAAGVGRVIYLGALGGDDTGLSEHLRSRRETGDVLRTCGVPVTELRAAIIVGSGSASFEIIRDLATKLPVMICPRWVNSRCEPIAVAHVLAYLVGVLNEPRSVGQTLDIGDGEVLTYGDLLRGCARVLGRRVRILTVPVLTPRLSSYWLNLVTAVPMSVARPLVEGLRCDVVTRDHRIREWIPLPRLTYLESVARALAGAAGAKVESRWTGATTAGAGCAAPQQPRAGAAPLVDRRVALSHASPAELFQRVQRVGGRQGWYFATALWHLRGAIDRILGGVGMRRGRNHPIELAAGDPVDFWRVEEITPGEMLCLRAEMRLPGVATLTFRVEAVDAGSAPSGVQARLTQTAEFWPSGIWGRAYWWMLWPIHVLIFRGMARRITSSVR